MNFALYSIVGAALLLSWFGIIADRTFYGIAIIAFGLVIGPQVSEWEQRSKDTHKRLAEAVDELERVKQALARLEQQINRLAGQMARWQ